MNKEQSARCREIACRYGDDQFLIVIEELSELQKAICKYVRALRDILNGVKPATTEATQTVGDVIEETADVYIMLEQCKHLMFIQDDVISKMIDEKLDRTFERMKAHEKT